MNARLVPFLVLGAAVLVAGCGQKRIVLCPGAAILADTANETIFRPGAPEDLSGVAYTASVSGVRSDCSFDQREGQSFSSIDLDFRAVRAPSPDGARYNLPYFVTLNSAGRVLSKKMYNVSFDFAPGAAVATTDISLDRTAVSLERGLLPTDYQFLVGFQLTQAQLAYNRTMGRYIP